MRILIGAPLRQKPHIFAEHLKSLDELVLPPGVEVDRYYIANKCDAATLALLKDGEYEIRDDLAPEDYAAEGNRDHTWTRDDMVKMGELRSIMTDKAYFDGYDYLLSVDTDLVLQRETLATLLAADKRIVSEVFWTTADNGFTWCNSWAADWYTIRKRDFEAWKTPGLYRVGMTGALVLIHRAVFEAGVSYRKIPNIETAIYGEDRHFCIRAACAGIPLYMDTHYPAVHLYREREYEDYMRSR